MRALLALLAPFFLLSAWGDRAGAGTLEVVYEITGGSFAAPPGGVVTGGSYTVRFQADGAMTPVSGPAVLETFSLRGSNQSVYYGNVLASHFTVLLTAQVSGSGTVASGFHNHVLGVLTGPAYLHCSGPNCATAGFPPSVTQSFPLRVTAQGSGINLHASGGSASGTYRLLGATDSFSLVFQGREVGRTFVPEPASSGLALIAAVGVLALCRANRRRHGYRLPPSPA